MVVHQQQLITGVLLPATAKSKMDNHIHTVIHTHIYTTGGHYPMLALVVYIAYTPLCLKCHLCTWRLAYILHESWLLGVFRVYMTLKPQPSEVCSAYAPRLWLGAWGEHSLLPSTGATMDTKNCKLPMASVQVVYMQNTPCNHDMYILHTYIQL